MAALTKMLYETRYAEFYVDNETELAKLPNTHNYGKNELKINPPVIAGSIARSPSKTYILMSNDTWVEYTGGGGGGGGVSRSEIWVGTTPPPDDGYKIWIDISGNDPSKSGYTDKEVEDIINDILNGTYGGAGSDKGTYTDKEIADLVDSILNGTYSGTSSESGSYSDEEVDDVISGILGG